MVRYFAYGSNLHPLRLSERVPSSRLLATGALPGHRLAFHKRGRDGSAKCDCMPTGCAEDRVLGAVFEFHPRERGVLDACEGAGYVARTVALTVGSGRMAVYLYQATPEAIDPRLRPFDWYKALVLAGARYHRLAPEYVAALAQVPAQADPDPHRAEPHQALLSRIAGHPCGPATTDRPAGRHPEPNPPPCAPGPGTAPARG